MLTLKRGGREIMSFGENLKRARKLVGITQTELAHQAGVTERSVYNYEKNSRAPKIDIVEKFAQALGVTSEMLMASDSITSWQATQNSIEKLLLQLQFIFNSDLEEEKKERFFEQITKVYFERQKSRNKDIE